LADIAHLSAGQRVLIHGGGGGVGHVAVQIAKAFGAYVIATASQTKHEFVRRLGADEIIDYKSADFTEVVRDADVVLDVIGQGYAERSLQSLRPGGLLITAVERTSATLPKVAAEAGRRFAGVAVEPDYPALERIAALVEAGKLRPFVEQVFPLEEIAKAHTLIERGTTQGKIVLSVA
jgi:NADPH:quinone reductase-like Zn-dependent oxidoreductase